MEVGRLLLDAGARTDIRSLEGHTAMSLAAAADATAFISLLLGARDNSHLPIEKQTASASASTAASASASEGVFVNGPYDVDRHPLVVACRAGSVDSLHLLAKAGGDVNMLTKDGRTLLLAMVDGVQKHVAVPGGSAAGSSSASSSSSVVVTKRIIRTNVIYALLELGADPDKPSHEAGPSGRPDEVLIRTATTAARASDDPDVKRAFDDWATMRRNRMEEDKAGAARGAASVARGSGSAL